MLGRTNFKQKRNAKNEIFQDVPGITMDQIFGKYFYLALRKRNERVHMNQLKIFNYSESGRGLLKTTSRGRCLKMYATYWGLQITSVVADRLTRTNRLSLT